MTRVPNVHSDAHYEQNYATRRALADEARAELDAAIAACGPGAEAYCRWTMHDKLGIEPPRYFYGCRRSDRSGWHPKPPENHDRVEQDVVTFVTDGGVKYVTGSAMIAGVKYYPFRYSMGFQALHEYRPRTPDQMKAAAERRRDKALTQIADETAAKAEAAARQPSLFGWAGLDEGER